jgi:hypothetical protein
MDADLAEVVTPFVRAATAPDRVAPVFAVLADHLEERGRESMGRAARWVGVMGRRPFGGGLVHACFWYAPINDDSTPGFSWGDLPVGLWWLLTDEVRTVASAKHYRSNEAAYLALLDAGERAVEESGWTAEPTWRTRQKEVLRVL